MAVQELTTRAFATAVGRQELHAAAAAGRNARLVEPALDMVAAYFPG
ncbi:hypothetical protein QRX50_32885 [Amycolatopsis carbonis]|uniref:Uncharacterized protein n=1 Tax=Amycolatopsis carbonis TaxID=715471 RepID=A0A9Y2IAB7_9PSEU|nr:hypothetical protein [Amycolatopsis sp. 2-15]WIX76244.1 hypothetical protein QRX50_32885 [Amycolatopsis sp. 2-15]